MSDTVDLISNTTLFSALESIKDLNSVSCAQEQELHDLMEFLKIEYKKNIQYRLLLDILEEYTEESDGNNTILKEKIRSIIIRHSASQTLMLDESAGSNMTVLGLGKDEKHSISYLEGNTLQEIVKAKLKEKHSLNVVDKEKMTSMFDNEKTHSNSLQLSSEEQVLLSTKQKLVFEQEQYIKNLLELQKILFDISDLRLNKLKEDVDLKIKQCETQDKINGLKAIFAEGKLRFDIFTETSSSLDAYKELIKDIKQQQDQYRKEIEDLEKLKEQYKQVSCKQFDEILISYKQYKSSLEQKKKLYDYLST